MTTRSYIPHLIVFTDKAHHCQSHLLSPLQTTHSLESIFCIENFLRRLKYPPLYNHHLSINSYSFLPSHDTAVHQHEPDFDPFLGHPHRFDPFEELELHELSVDPSDLDDPLADHYVTPKKKGRIRKKPRVNATDKQGRFTLYGQAHLRKPTLPGSKVDVYTHVVPLNPTMTKKSMMVLGHFLNYEMTKELDWLRPFVPRHGPPTERAVLIIQVPNCDPGIHMHTPNSWMMLNIRALSLINSLAFVVDLCESYVAPKVSVYFLTSNLRDLLCIDKPLGCVVFCLSDSTTAEQRFVMRCKFKPFSTELDFRNLSTV